MIKRAYHPQKLLCNLAFWVTESDLHEQKVQILSFQSVFGIFKFLLPLKLHAVKNWQMIFFCPPTVVFGYKRRTRTHTKNLEQPFKAPSPSWPYVNFRAIRLAPRVQSGFFVPVPRGFVSLEKNGIY